MPWGIEKLYEDTKSESFMHDICLFEKLVNDIDNILLQLNSAPLDLAKVNEYLCIFEKTKKLFEGLKCYCYLLYFYDTTERWLLHWISKVDQMELTLAVKEIEFIDILKKTEQSHLDLAPLEDAYKVYFIRQREKAKKLLSVKEEHLLENFKKLSLCKWQKLYEDTKRTVDFSVEGDYGLAEEVFAACFVKLKEGRQFLAQQKGYNSLLEQSVEGSRMSMMTFNNFKNSVQKHIPELSHFFDIRQELSNQNMKKVLSDEEKLLTLKKALGRLGQNIEKYIDNCFSCGWIDSDIRDTKRSGNYCAPLRSINEIRIRVESLKTKEDLVGLAHEMGHGYHLIQMMQGPFLEFDFPLAVSETPSVFFAITMLDYFLDNSDDRDRITYLDQLICLLAFEILHMYSRFEFEQEVVEKLDHSTITSNDLNKLMSNILRKNFSESTPSSFIDARLWMKKIQFFASDKDYYNYPYVIGTIITIMLLENFKHSPSDFESKFNKFLAMTANSTFEDMINVFGYDASNSEFWDNAMRLIVERIDCYEELVASTK